MAFRHALAMTQALERNLLPVRLADLIESEIKKGSWQHHLAGHRALMELYAVSARTCLRAIEILESRGLISEAQVGKKRRIVDPKLWPDRAIQNLLIIHSSGAQSGEDLLQLHAFRKAWQEARGQVQVVHFDMPRYRKPAALLREAIASHQADAILLHVAPLAWVEAAQNMKPVFLSGGEWHGTSITGVGYDVREEIIRAVEKLKDRGHQRILLPMDLIGQRMEQAIRQGLARGLGLSAEGATVKRMSPIFPERIPSAWQGYWKKTFSAVKPSAVILLDDIHYLSLQGYCFAHGIRIPQDVSVICLENSGHLEWCEPVPTRMRFPMKEAVRHFRKWMRGSCIATGMKFLRMDWAEGASIARARG